MRAIAQPGVEPAALSSAEVEQLVKVVDEFIVAAQAGAPGQQSAGQAG